MTVQMNWIQSFFKHNRYKIAIILTGYLLMSTYVIVHSGLLERSGSIEIEDEIALEGTPSSTILTENCSPLHYALLQNCTDYNGYISFSLPLYEYELVRINFTGRTRIGNESVQVTVNVAGLFFFIEGMLNEFQTEEMYLDLPLEQIRNESSGWARYCSVNLNYQVLPNLAVSKLVIEAYSSFDLYPITIDTRTMDDECIFSNPFTEDLHRRPALRMDNNLYEGEFGKLVPRQVNETYYLRTSSLMGEVYFDYLSEVNFRGLNVSFVVGNYSTHVILHLPIMKLYISITPAIPILGIEIGERYGVRDAFYGIIVNETTIPEFLYLPATYQFKVRFSILDDTNLYGDSISIAEDDYYIGQKSEIHMKVVFPFLNYYGFLFTVGDLLLALITVLFICVTIISLRSIRKKTDDKLPFSFFDFLDGPFTSCLLFILVFFIPSGIGTHIMFDGTTRTILVNSFSLLNNYYLQTELFWFLSVVPYTFLCIMSIQGLSYYTIGKSRLRDVALLCISSVAVMIPGTLVLNWFGSTVWMPLPILPLLILLFIPLCHFRNVGKSEGDPTNFEVEETVTD